MAQFHHQRPNLQAGGYSVLLSSGIAGTISFFKWIAQEKPGSSSSPLLDYELFPSPAHVSPPAQNPLATLQSVLDPVSGFDDFYMTTQPSSKGFDLSQHLLDNWKTWLVSITALLALVIFVRIIAHFAQDDMEEVLGDLFEIHPTSHKPKPDKATDLSSRRNASDTISPTTPANPDISAPIRANYDVIADLIATIAKLRTQMSDQSSSATALSEQQHQRISDLERVHALDEQQKGNSNLSIHNLCIENRRASAQSEQQDQRILDLERLHASDEERKSNLNRTIHNLSEEVKGASALSEQRRQKILNLEQTLDHDTKEKEETAEKVKTLIKRQSDIIADKEDAIQRLRAEAVSRGDSQAAPVAPGDTKAGGKGKDRFTAPGDSGKHGSNDAKPEYELLKGEAGDRVLIKELCSHGQNCQQMGCRWAHQSPVGAPGVFTNVDVVCEAKENCTNPMCTGRHPSPSLKPPPGMSKRAWQREMKNREFAEEKSKLPKPS